MVQTASLQKILKECKKEFNVPLALLINISIETGTQPECLKLTNVIPGYKGGDKDNCNNYKTNCPILKHK